MAPLSLGGWQCGSLMTVLPEAALEDEQQGASEDRNSFQKSPHATASLLPGAYSTIKASLKAHTEFNTTSGPFTASHLPFH